jgi:integrase
MPYQGSLAHLEKDLFKPYKLPKLYDHGNSLTNKNGKPARWFVYYSYLDPKTRKFKRFKEYGKLNQLKTKAERTKYADQLISHFTDLLTKGFNPFIPLEEQFFGEVTTLEQAIQTFISRKARILRAKTMTGYRSILTKLLMWAKRQGLANLPMAQLTVIDLEPYFLYGHTKNKLAATTHNTELTTIRAFFTYWQERAVIQQNPARSIKRQREAVGLHMAYSDDQIQRITEHLKGINTAKAAQLYQFIQWIYYTCIRPKELLSLTVGDIRLQTNTIIVPAKVSKTSRTESVDISPGLAEVIKSMNLDGLPANWYIFGNQGKGVWGDYSDVRPGPKPVGVNFLSKSYRKILDELGIGREYTLYGWKHTRNVHLWLQTKDLMRIMRHNRHTDPKVTMRYLRSLGLLIDSRLEDERRI